MAYVGDKKRNYQLRWIKLRRQEWIDQNGPCKNCGSNEKLTVDHIDRRSKVLSVSSVWSLARDNPKRLEELRKCQVLCEPCHLQKNFEENSVSCHDRKAERKCCKCDFCRTVHTERVREYRNRISK
jgi:5-methylcytosine-specific restriction endonuclease McrA